MMMFCSLAIVTYTYRNKIMSQKLRYTNEFISG